jgi:ubiquinone/menaquinone biosynthesis C-methylase UbiE
VLDVGFGQGRTTSLLVQRGHRVIGVEVSPTMVKQATARNRTACRDGRADLRLGDGVTIPFPDRCADAAISAHTIYFMEDPAATISEIARVLRPGGTLAIACRTSDDEPPAWMDMDVYRLRSIEEITTMLRGAGFGEITRQRGHGSHHAIQLFVGHLALTD